ncbi:MAG: hypothetical protein P1V97_24645 [Planctomycetota bacterium]|nr:hypothetical protein [Planctomycetota bacterium]
MSVCGLNLESDVGNIWLRRDGDLHKRIFVNLVASDVEGSTRDTMTQRAKDVHQLRSAFLSYHKNPSSEAWRAVTKWQKNLAFPFSLLGHVEQLAQNFFSDDDNPNKTIFFGEGLLGLHFSLPQISNPLRRLLRLGRDEDNEDYGYDRESGIVRGVDKLTEDYGLSRQLLAHLMKGVAPSDEPRRVVVAVSANASALSRCILFQLLRDVGFSAVVFRPHSELIARHKFDEGASAPIVLTLGTVRAELRYKPEGHMSAMETVWAKHGEEVDRVIETMVQQRIREEEAAHAGELSFESIASERLFFWKDAYRSDFWTAIARSARYFHEFQYPYKLRDKLTFRDARPYLSDDLLRQANSSVLKESLKVGFESLTQWLKESASKDMATEIPPILIAGSGAKIEGIADEVAAIYAESLKVSKDKVTVTCVSETLDSVVDGSLKYAESIPEDDWAAIEEIQKPWLDKSIGSGQVLEWFDVWRKTLSEDRYCQALHYNMASSD